jgi:hypothetical protein
MSEVTNRRRSKAAAFHEAAHAVARLHVGERATGVLIGNDGSGLSLGTGQQWAAGHGQYSAWNLVLYCLAGPYAEARVSRRARALVMLTGGGEKDYRVAQNPVRWLVTRGYADTESAAWERGERETLAFLGERWAAIARVADALLQSGRLSASEVRALAEETGAAKAHG